MDSSRKVQLAARMNLSLRRWKVQVMPRNKRRTVGNMALDHHQPLQHLKGTPSGLSLFTQPDRTKRTFSINSDHKRYLRSTLARIPLIDTDGICPEDSCLIGPTQWLQGCVEVRGDWKPPSVQPDVACDVWIAPNVREGFKLRFIVERNDIELDLYVFMLLPGEDGHQPNLVLLRSYCWRVEDAILQLSPLLSWDSLFDGVCRARHDSSPSRVGHEYSRKEVQVTTRLWLRAKPSLVIGEPRPRCMRISAGLSKSVTEFIGCRLTWMIPNETGSRIVNRSNWM